MKYLGKITDSKDLVTKEYADKVVDNKLVTTTLASYSALLETPTSDRLYEVRYDKDGHLSVQVPWVNTEYEVKSEASGGTAASLVTTGMMYTWNHHTHTTTLATDTGTSSITLASQGKYKLTAGGTSVIFTMPKSNYYTHPTYTAHDPAAVKIGNDGTGHVVIGNAITAADVGAAASDHTHATSIATSSGTSQITLAHGGKYAITAGGTSYIFTMPASGNTNTWRNIQVNGTQILGTGTSTGALNIADGTNITVTNSSGTVYINAPASMTAAEATTGTETGARVISPKVLADYVDTRIVAAIGGAY